MRRFTAVLAAAIGVATLLGAAQAPAKPMKIGFADTVFRSGDASERQKWLGRSKRAGSKIVRIDVSWRSTAPTQPVLATNPNDPAYNWGTLDGAIADANAKGLDPMVTVSLAPNWAEGPNRPGNVNAGTWKPDADAYGDFGQALATRYGSQLRYYQAWNEGNIFTFLMPQYEGGQNVGPEIYRRLLNAFYEGVHSVDSDAKVISGGTAPYGDPPGGRRTRPLTFLRELLCLDGDNKPKQNCNTKAKLDAIAHHPINTSGGPTQSAAHPDDATTPDVKNVTKIMRKAEQANTVGTSGRHQIWLTEFWWETRPPDECVGVSLSKQKQWIGQALRSFKRQGASVAINYLIRDQKYENNQCGRSTFQTGAFFHNGKKKPSFKAFKNYAK